VDNPAVDIPAVGIAAADRSALAVVARRNPSVGLGYDGALVSGKCAQVLINRQVAQARTCTAVRSGSILVPTYWRLVWL
jgi:hypothetical protein